MCYGRWKFVSDLSYIFDDLLEAYFEKPEEGSYRGIRKKFREYVEYCLTKG